MPGREPRCSRTRPGRSPACGKPVCAGKRQATRSAPPGRSPTPVWPASTRAGWRTRSPIWNAPSPSSTRYDESSATVAVSSFLCLAKPSDRRVPEWLAGALRFADESGDRTKQVAALTSLAWHHFLRSLWGGPADTATAERLALRLAEVAEDLGAIEPAIQARSLLAIMARLSGRIQPAVTETKLLTRHLGLHRHEPWLGWAASFAVARADGASHAAPPFPPVNSPDPVAGVAAHVIRTELVLAGRGEEVMGQLRALEGKQENVISDAMGVPLRPGPGAVRPRRGSPPLGRACRPGGSRHRCPPRGAGGPGPAGRDQRRRWGLTSCAAAGLVPGGEPVAAGARLAG